MDVSGKVMNKVLEKGLGIYHRYIWIIFYQTIVSLKGFVQMDMNF